MSIPSSCPPPLSLDLVWRLVFPLIPRKNASGCPPALLYLDLLDVCLPSSIPCKYRELVASGVIQPPIQIKRAVVMFPKGKRKEQNGRVWRLRYGAMRCGRAIFQIKECIRQPPPPRPLQSQNKRTKGRQNKKKRKQKLKRKA